jgi:fimbrial chaperone protein
MPRSPVTRAAVLVLAVASAGVAEAGSLGVAPTRVELGPGSPSGVVTLQNNGADAIMVQVQTFAWPRSVAIDDLEPTHDLIAVPPVFALEPKAKQIIRVALRSGDVPAAAERAYRLLITEVPGSVGAGAGMGVRFALRLSLPVFVTPTGARAVPEWSVQRHPTGPAALQLANHGTAYLQVRRIALRAAGRPEPLQTIEETSYVLTGQVQSWPLSEAVRGQGTLRLQAETNLGPIEATVVVPRG